MPRIPRSDASLPSNLDWLPNRSGSIDRGLRDKRTALEPSPLRAGKSEYMRLECKERVRTFGSMQPNPIPLVEMSHHYCERKQREIYPFFGNKMAWQIKYRGHDSNSKTERSNQTHAPTQHQTPRKREKKKQKKTHQTPPSFLPSLQDMVRL